MDMRKELTRQIRNARGRLKRLSKRRSDGPEAREAFENAPLAQGATYFIKYLDREIKKENNLIIRLKRKRAKIKR